MAVTLANGGSQIVTSSATKSGTSYGPELLIALRGGRRRAQLEDRLRELVRNGTLPAGARLPSSRALADDLDVSRRLVVDAYAQLLAEGYLVSHRGAGTFVAANAGVADGVAAGAAAARRCSSTSSPASPTSRAFPRALWSGALRDVLRTAPRERVRLSRRAWRARAAHGAERVPAARARRRRRARLDRHLRRRHARPRAARARARAPRRDAIAVEDPGLPPHRAVLAYAGLDVRGAPVDEHGVDLGAVAAPVVLADARAPMPDGRRARARAAAAR